MDGPATTLRRQPIAVHLQSQTPHAITPMMTYRFFPCRGSCSRHRALFLRGRHRRRLGVVVQHPALAHHSDLPRQHRRWRLQPECKRTAKDGNGAAVRARGARHSGGDFHSFGDRVSAALELILSSPRVPPGSTRVPILKFHEGVTRKLRIY